MKAACNNSSWATDSFVIASKLTNMDAIKMSMAKFMNDDMTEHRARQEVEQQ